MSTQEPPRKDDLFYSTIPELQALLRSRKMSCQELVRAYLDRIKQLDSRLNAFITVTEVLAFEQAQRVDREIQRQTSLGPLHGIPYGAKDLLATKGIPTTWGSKVFARQVFDYDAAVVGRLRDAGAVLVGKLN